MSKTLTKEMTKEKVAVKTILVSQPAPTQDSSPYFDLIKKMNVKIDFRSFIHVQGVEATEFRKERIKLSDYQSVILTSKNEVDHFFRIALFFLLLSAYSPMQRTRKTALAPYSCVKLSDNRGDW